MNYKDLLRGITNSSAYREKEEWSNFWLDNADREKKGKRYLLIGDSTARMVRSTFAKLTNASVDMLGTSSALDDILFVSQIEAFFSHSIYKYDAIFVQLGHHGRISHNGGDYTKDDYLKFEEDYLKLISFLKEQCDNIIIESIFDSVLPISGWFNLLLKKLCVIKEENNERINACTTRKNEILKNLEIYGRGGVSFLDINRLTKSKNFHHIDHIHFERKAKSFIAHEMMKLL